MQNIRLLVMVPYIRAPTGQELHEALMSTMWQLWQQQGLTMLKYC